MNYESVDIIQDLNDMMDRDPNGEVVVFNKVDPKKRWTVYRTDNGYQIEKPSGTFSWEVDETRLEDMMKEYKIEEPPAEVSPILQGGRRRRIKRTRSRKSHSKKSRKSRRKTRRRHR